MRRRSVRLAPTPFHKGSRVAKSGWNDAREQDTLSRICRKLRAGDVLKFMREIRMEDE